MKTLQCAILAPLLVVPWDVWGMARPRCNFLESFPINAVQKVRIQTGSTGNIDGISAAEGEAAILSALQRWNQQSESGISFQFDGYSASVSNNYGLIRFVTNCESSSHVNGYIENTPNGKSWIITICNQVTITGTSNVFPRNFVSTPNLAVGSAQDIMGTLMHELGHAQGLAHPGVHLPSPTPLQAYCGGDAAVMGSNSCVGNTYHGGWRRDLYRYDLTCTEERNGLYNVATGFRAGTAFSRPTIHRTHSAHTHARDLVWIGP